MLEKINQLLLKVTFCASLGVLCCFLYSARINVNDIENDRIMTFTAKPIPMHKLSAIITGEKTKRGVVSE